MQSRWFQSNEAAAVLTRAGIDPRLVGDDLQEAAPRAIALRRSSCSWTEIEAGWRITLTVPEVRRFFGTTLEEALTRCLGLTLHAVPGVTRAARHRDQAGSPESRWSVDSHYARAALHPAVSQWQAPRSMSVAVSSTVVVSGFAQRRADWATRWPSPAPAGRSPA